MRSTAFLLLAALVPLAAAKWDGLFVKWDALGALSYMTNSAFFKLPMSVNEAQSKGWSQARTSDTYSTWCYQNDPRACVLLDNSGTLAGLQISIPATDVQFSGNPYDVTQNPSFNKDNLLGMDVFAARMFFESQDTLTSGGRAADGLVGNGLWLQRGDEYTQIPLTGPELESQAWTKENCIPTMGRHYYYNMTENTDCSTIDPYFIITNNYNSNVHGLGFQTFGTPSKKSRQWFESVPYFAVKPTVPTAPDCLVDWVKQYGLISIHVYFVKGPWLILC